MIAFCTTRNIHCDQRLDLGFLFSMIVRSGIPWFLRMCMEVKMVEDAWESGGVTEHDVGAANGLFSMSNRLQYSSRACRRIETDLIVNYNHVQKQY